MLTPENLLNLRSCHPEFQTYLDINESESQRIRKNFTNYLNEPYGKAQLQTVDIFPSTQPNSPILIFIHGGYWRGLDKKSYSFIAEPFIQRDVTVCVINYRLIPSVDMKGLIQDVNLAITWIQNEAKRFNGNPNALILSGHSAGGHLALISYLMNESLRPRPSVKAICSLSGLFDLAPIKNSYLNETLNLTDADVSDFSVSNKDLSVLKCPVLLSVGSNETDLFIEQSKDLYVKNRTKAPIEYYEYEKLNHYQIVHKLGQIDSVLVQFILDKTR